MELSLFKRRYAKAILEHFPALFLLIAAPEQSIAQIHTHLTNCSVSSYAHQALDFQWIFTSEKPPLMSFAAVVETVCIPLSILVVIPYLTV